MNRLLLSWLFICGTCKTIVGQDSAVVNFRVMDSITTISFSLQHSVRPLPSIFGTYIFSGKKTESIDLQYLPADLTNKTGRQLFAKIPGVFVYDMDGAGNQLSIAARGLDPHRGWEFNMRKDGIIINSDMYGYPASHYSMPMESLSRIEIVRGTGSLQYGAQFGGMINFISKQGDSIRPVSFESINTVGSFRLASTYNAIGGTKGKFRYYAYFHKKTRDGYRENEHTSAEAAALNLSYQINSSMILKAEWSRTTYRYRIPGPLTDSMFHENPKQATRSRNYYSPDIHVPSLSLNWDINEKTTFICLLSGVIGSRNSVLFDKPANIKDSIDPVTLQYSNRQVDIDRFKSYTAETRLMHEYKTGQQQSAFTAGIQLMHNRLQRQQLGRGSTGSGYDLRLVTPGWGRDLTLKTNNIALFIENKFQLTREFAISTGARIEYGRTRLSGIISYYPENKIPLHLDHRFPLFGIHFSYKPGKISEVYGGWSQSYRPMLFKDLIPASLYEKVDSNLRDSRGYNAELGYRGSWKFLRWDINGYMLRYNNRFGMIAETDNTGTLYTIRTNIGHSVTYGMEILLQGNWLTGKQSSISLFFSTAFANARYRQARIKSGNHNISINGNKVESVPGLITRNGCTFRYRKAGISFLYSYTAETFADALNTVIPLKTTAAAGKVPGYGLLDINATLRVSDHIDIRMNLNNVTNNQYFTKRPLLYPGPGVWPSDGRNASLTLILRF